MTGTLSVARLLAEHGASLRATDAAGNTPLHGAAESGNADLVAYLLSRKARPSARNKAGKRPVDIAREGGHGEVVGLLSQK